MNGPERFALVCWAGAFVAVAAAVLLPRGEYMAEGPPVYEPLDLAALVLSIVAALLLTAPAMRSSSVEAGQPRWFEAAAMLLAILTALGGIVCVIVSPTTFTYWVQEDSIAEWVSAGAVFAGSLVLVAALLLWRPPERSWSARLRILLLALAAVMLLLIGLEEVSWFQRQIGFTTPQWFEQNNGQRELNLHNLQTSFFENAYYVGGALVLVGGRLLLHLPLQGEFTAWLARFAPGWTAFAFGVITIAFNWDMWRIVNIEVAFALGVFVTLMELAWAVRAKSHGTTTLLGLLAATALAVQTVLLVRGHTLTREWDATEAKELFIALGLLAYAMEQALQLRQLQGPEGKDQKLVA